MHAEVLGNALCTHARTPLVDHYASTARKPPTLFSVERLAARRHILRQVARDREMTRLLATAEALFVSINFFLSPVT